MTYIYIAMIALGIVALYKWLEDINLVGIILGFAICTFILAELISAVPVVFFGVIIASGLVIAWKNKHPKPVDHFADVSLDNLI